MELPQVLTPRLIDETVQRIREHGLPPPYPIRTFTPQQIEQVLIDAGYIPDFRRENAVLARAFWRENWHRGFWPVVRLLV